jgi:hypothetical protein
LKIQIIYATVLTNKKMDTYCVKSGYIAIVDWNNAKDSSTIEFAETTLGAIGVVWCFHQPSS